MKRPTAAIGGSDPCPGRARADLRRWLSCLGLWAVSALHAGAQTTTAVPVPPVPPPTWRLSATNMTRLEAWRFFEPRPGGGDPDYIFLADRLRVDVRGHWRKADLMLAAQGVGMAGLPETASGPGALGAGPLYFDQGGRRSNTSQLYLRLANVRFPNLLPGVDLAIGRMGYASGAEGPTGIPKLETVKRQRLDTRTTLPWKQDSSRSFASNRRLP